MASPSQSYAASPAVWDHTVLPATRNRWTRPAIVTMPCDSQQYNMQNTCKTRSPSLLPSLVLTETLSRSYQSE